jgi:hypothetical protein
MGNPAAAVYVRSLEDNAAVGVKSIFSLDARAIA